MTTEEIFEKICNHMKEGICFHEEMAKAYYFLGLYEFAEVQEQRYKEEFKSYNKIIKYYMTHYFKLLKETKSEKQSIIPDNWYKYNSQAVDINTKRNGIKELTAKWIEWEKNTKKLYEEMYSELTILREVAAATKIQKCIKEVDKELSDVEQKQLNLDAVGYNLEVIIKDFI